VSFDKSLALRGAQGPGTQKAMVAGDDASDKGFDEGLH
jgi:hypothetical protein